MDVILGLIMIYVWVHSIIIYAHNSKHLTKYENGLIIVGMVLVALCVIGATGY
jgi:hypothetical protein